MADEEQGQTVEPQEAAPAEEFDWGQFFMEDVGPQAAAAAPQRAPEPVAEAPEPRKELDAEAAEPPSDVSLLRKQIAELQNQVAETQKLTTSTAQQAKMSAAIEAWKQQANPAELAMADQLLKATTVEELRIRADAIKDAAKGFGKQLESERIRMERELQVKFGLPVTPEFQPVPDQAEYKKALEEGNIDRAAALAMKGVFNT